MKEKATIMFFENKLSGYTNCATKILGLDIVRYCNCKIENFFNNETTMYLKSIAEGKTKGKLGFPSGVVMDADIIKTTISEYQIYIIEFFSDSGIMPLKGERDNTLFENIAFEHLPVIENIMNELLTAKNSKKLHSLQEEIMIMFGKLNKLIYTIQKNDIVNAPEGFSCIDLWDIIREFEKDIRAVGNIQIETIPCSAFNTYTQIRRLKELIIGILNHYSVKGERAYLSFFKSGDNAVIRIANFPANNADSLPNNIRFPVDDIKATLDFQKQASAARIAFARNMHTEKDNEFLLTFAPDKFETINEI